MEFIDTHQHLIYRDRLGYAWTNGIPALATGDFTLADYARPDARSGVTGTVFMETGVDDADYQSEARLVAGLMHDPATGCWARSPVAARGGRGLRRTGSTKARTSASSGYAASCMSSPTRCRRPARFRAQPARRSGGAACRSTSASSRASCRWREDLLAACDEQTFVLDHCGVPDIAGGGFAPGPKGCAAVAAFPHVVCKLSGITAYCAPGTGHAGDGRALRSTMCSSASGPTACSGAATGRWSTSARACPAGSR